MRTAGLPRWIEVPLAMAGLAATAPLWLAAALAIRLSTPGPAFFRQRRVGRDGVEFVLYKLRSMSAAADAGPRITAGGDPRITAVGRWLRKSKLDELPGLWNVVRGDLALVGPRPEIPEFVDLGDRRWRRVLAVRPGLTDPVTLRLRDEEELLASIADDRERFYAGTLVPFKLRGYIAYLEQRSPWTDLAVLWRTMLGILWRGRLPPPTLEELGVAPAAHEHRDL